MKITDELIETIYQRATEYCIAKYGREPDRLRLNEGDLKADYIRYSCGDEDVDSYIINASNLTEDLDKVYDDRMKAKEEKRLQVMAELKKQQAFSVEQATRQRKIQYEKLKKEFEV